MNCISDFVKNSRSYDLPSASSLPESLDNLSKLSSSDLVNHAWISLTRVSSWGMQKKTNNLRNNHKPCYPCLPKLVFHFPWRDWVGWFGRSIGGIVCGYNSRVAYVFDSQDAAASFSSSDAYDLLVFFFAVNLIRWRWRAMSDKLANQPSVTRQSSPVSVRTKWG